MLLIIDPLGGSEWIIGVGSVNYVVYSQFRGVATSVTGRLSGLLYFVPTLLFPYLLFLDCLLPRWLCLISFFPFSCAAVPSTSAWGQQEWNKREHGKSAVGTKWSNPGGIATAIGPIPARTVATPQSCEWIYYPIISLTIPNL